MARGIQSHALGLDWRLTKPRPGQASPHLHSPGRGHILRIGKGSRGNVRSQFGGHTHRGAWCTVEGPLGCGVKHLLEPGMLWWRRQQGLLWLRCLENMGRGGCRVPCGVHESRVLYLLSFKASIRPAGLYGPHGILLLRGGLASFAEPCARDLTPHLCIRFRACVGELWCLVATHRIHNTILHQCCLASFVQACARQPSLQVICQEQNLFP